MMSTLQPDESWKPKSNKDEPQKKQYEAQKALLDSRFLTTLGQIMQNKDMGDAIKNGKFDIISQSSPDFLWSKIESNYNYKTPNQQTNKLSS